MTFIKKIMNIGRSKMKKNWKKPELVVLVKGTSDENVLMHCKAGSGTIGPDRYVNWCKFDDCTTNCELAPTT